jgi:N-acyl-D-amino-acid deacylase
MDEGARGFSTGLIYPPGLFAGAEEVTRLAAVVGRRGGVYASHLRSESATLLEALDEFLAVGRASGARLQVSHLKTSGSENWGKLDAAFERIRRAREDGVTVAADRYPYTAGWTDLDVVLPTWAKAGGRDAILARLRDADTRRRLRDELWASRPAEAWAGVIVGSVKVAEWRDLQGQPVPDVARRLGLDPVDAILAVLDRDELRTGAFFAGMSEENMFRILADPRVMLGSDASIRSTTGPLSQDYPHPRAYGCMPRFLRLALDGRTVPLAEAIRKMTALPAEHFGLGDRGLLRRGLKADVTVFDPARVRDTSDYARPHSLAEGVRHVVVNGVAVLANGALTGQRSGRFLE